MVPVIAALSYELIHFSAAHADNRLIRYLLAPGLILQAMTTRKPSDIQLKAAISALRGVIEADQLQEDG